MSNLFGENNAFINFMTRVADVLILNTIFLVCCVPIFTIGPAYTAMYYYCMKAVKNEEGYLLRSFWKSFKTNFVQSFILEIIFVFLAWVVYIDVQFMNNKVMETGSIVWRLLFFVVMGMVLLILMTFIYTFPILAKFDNKSTAIIKNAMFMSIRHMGQTVPLVFLFAIAVFIAYFLSPFSLFFVFGTWVYISSIFFTKIFSKYIDNGGVDKPEDYYMEAELPTPIETESSQNHDEERVEDNKEKETDSSENNFEQ